MAQIPDLEKEERGELASRFASDVSVLGLLQVVSRFRGLVLLPVVARLLGTAAYGVWTQSMVFVSIGASVISMQLQNALVRFVSGTSDRYEWRANFLPILALVASAGIIASGLVYFGANVVARYVLGDGSYRSVASLLGIWVALAAISQLGFHMLRAIRRVKLYGVLSTIHNLLQVVIVGLIVYFLRDLELAVIGAIGLEAAFALISVGLVLQSVGTEWPGFHRLRPSFAYSLPLIPSFYASVLMMVSDRLIIASILGAEAVGIYAAGYSLARIIQEIYGPIQSALLPAISEVWDRGLKQEVHWVLSNAMRYYLIVAIPAFIGLTILGPNALELMAPDISTLSLKIVIPFLGLGLLSGKIQTAIGSILALLKHTGELAISQIASSFVYVFLVVYFVSRWGLTGGAAATALAYLLHLSITVIFVIRSEGVVFPFRSAGQSVLAGLGMIPVVLLVDRTNLGGLLTAIAVGSIAYAAILVLVGGLGKKEWLFLRSLVISS